MNGNGTDKAAEWERMSGGPPQDIGWARRMYQNRPELLRQWPCVVKLPHQGLCGVCGGCIGAISTPKPAEPVK